MLKKDGLMYLVGVKENNPTKIAQDLTEQGMSCEVFLLLILLFSNVLYSVTMLNIMTFVDCIAETCW